MDVFVAQGLVEVGAGIRQLVTAFVADHPGLRVIDEAFMQIRQGVGFPRSTDAAALEWLGGVICELVASGWVAAALARAGQDPGLTATG